MSFIKRQLNVMSFSNITFNHYSNINGGNMVSACRGYNKIARLGSTESGIFVV